MKKLLLTVFAFLAFSMAIAQSVNGCKFGQIRKEGKCVEESEDPLPVSFISFKASVAKEGAQLVWRFADPVDHSHFKIERSKEGFQFETVGITEAANYTDEPAASGVWYYRLSSVDLDGTEHLFKVIAVNVPEVLEFPAYDLKGNLKGRFATTYDLPKGKHIFKRKIVVVL